MKSSKIGWVTAGSLVVANMVGTGVFTSLGYQVVDIHNTWSIIWIWVLGMILALCGAVSYAELATHVKRSGGEYAFLTHVYHPLPGFSVGMGFAVRWFCRTGRPCSYGISWVHAHVYRNERYCSCSSYNPDYRADTFVFHSTEQLVAKWYYCSQSDIDFAANCRRILHFTI